MKLAKNWIDEFCWWDRKSEVTAAQVKMIQLSAFMEGFKRGREEQHARDWPDVGFRFDKEAINYWKEINKNEN